MMKLTRVGTGTDVWIHPAHIVRFRAYTPTEDGHPDGKTLIEYTDGPFVVCETPEAVAAMFARATDDTAGALVIAAAVREGCRRIEWLRATAAYASSEQPPLGEISYTRRDPSTIKKRTGYNSAALAVARARCHETSAELCLANDDCDRCPVNTLPPKKASK